ncbi:ROK family protein [Nonomuraea sp. NPDC049649]|uniref:ROK family protein n=1 Tax=Nonomuraea sp. NPDC049649 TaxID=3155776 RepID=UPI00343C1D05
MAENGATTSGQLRTHNSVRLLRAVHDGAAAKTRAQLTRELGLARGTASVLVSGLTEDFLLHEEPTAEHARGRPTMVPGPHPRGPVALAADVREDAWELVACELGGRVTVLETRPHDGTPQDALATLGTALRTHATRYAGRVIGVGVAVAGPVRPDGRVDVPHLRWRSVDVPTLLASQPPHPGEAQDAPVDGTPPHQPGEKQTALHPSVTPERTDTPHARPGGTPGGPGEKQAAPLPSVTPERADTPHAPSRGAPGGAGEKQAAPLSSLTPEHADTPRGAVWLPGSGWVTVRVGNDTALAGLAEARRGRLRGVRVGLHLHVDFDLGGVLVVGGRPLGGTSGSGAEFGHMPLTGGDAPCMCGARGCWSLDVGVNALLRQLGLEYGGGRGRDRAGEILARAQEGDARAREAVLAGARALGRGIAALVNAHDPEVVTLSGLGVELAERAGAELAGACEPGLMTIRRECPPPIAPSELGGRGALLGAMEAVFDEFLTPAGLTAWQRTTRPET